VTNVYRYTLNKFDTLDNKRYILDVVLPGEIYTVFAPDPRDLGTDKASAEGLLRFLCTIEDSKNNMSSLFSCRTKLVLTSVWENRLDYMRDCSFFNPIKHQLEVKKDKEISILHTYTILQVSTRLDSRVEDVLRAFVERYKEEISHLRGILDKIED
jgi:hypothetical protein